MNKKIFCIFLTVILTLNGMVLAAAAVNTSIKLNDKSIIFKHHYPTNVSGKVFAPFDETFQAMGAETTWDADKKVIRIFRGNKQIALQIGLKTMSVGTHVESTGVWEDQKVFITVAPVMLNDHPMLPVADVASALGATIGWDPTTKIISINDTYSREAVGNTFGNSPGNSINGGLVSSQGNLIYYAAGADKGAGITKIQADGQNKRLLTDDKASNINVVGEFVYYRNEKDSKFYRLKAADGSDKKKIIDSKVDYAVVFGEDVYYSNLSRGGRLYRTKKSMGRLLEVQLTEEKVEYINVTADWIYYSNTKDSGKVYKIPTNSSSLTKGIEVSSNGAKFINVVKSKIYYSNTNDGGLAYSMNIDGKSNTKLSNFKASYINVVDNFLYCTDDSKSSREVCKIDISTKKSVNFASCKGTKIQLSKGWIYYQNSSKDTLSRASADDGSLIQTMN